MALRIPRGFAVNRPYFLELCEGARPNVHAVPLEAWSGLPPVRIDEYHHDPIVIDPGTIVGIGPEGASDGASGKLFPAAWQTGTSKNYIFHYHSDGASWGLETTASGNFNITDNVKPIGVVYQPVYSFMLQKTFTNYTRNVNVGVLTDYVIQIPAVTSKEALIRAGDVVMVAYDSWRYGQVQWGTHNDIAGRYEKVDTSKAGWEEFVVGRCLAAINFATGSAAGKRLVDDLDNVTLTADGQAEFATLNRLQTVPGLKLSGSGTKGIPGHLLGAVSDSSNKYWALTLLIRL